MSEWSLFPDAPEGLKAGWLHDNEDFAWLDSLEDGTPFGRSDYEPMPMAVRLVKPSTWLRIEDQNGFGSCQGHSLSSCAEVAHWLATGGEVIQLSRWFAYVGTQIIDGIWGDQGSTISGGATLAKTKGICHEDAYPYPRRYTREISTGQYKAAEKYRLKTFRRMRTSEDVWNWLDSGLGAISIGVRWGNGGHAVCITETLDDGSGVKVANSWSESYGDRGWFTWTRREMDRLLNDNYTVAIGMTDMDEVKPRDLNWSLFG